MLYKIKSMIKQIGVFKTLLLLFGFLIGGIIILLTLTLFLLFFLERVDNRYYETQMLQFVNLFIFFLLNKTIKY